MGPIAEVDLSLVQFAELIDCYLLHFQHGRLVLRIPVKLNSHSGQREHPDP
jgi:hypothetical protein